MSRKFGGRFLVLGVGSAASKRPPGPGLTCQVPDPTAEAWLLRVFYQPPLAGDGLQCGGSFRPHVNMRVPRKQRMEPPV